MAVIVLVWAFAVICLFACGWLLLTWIAGDSNGELNGVVPFHVCLCGIAVIATLCNVWAYVAPIGAAINIIVLASAIVIFVSRRATLTAYVGHWGRVTRSLHWGTWVGVVAIILIALLKSAGPAELIDEGAYFLPYIRWIEHFPIVPGIANIEDRFGFNSLFHMASAFFGLSWLVRGGAYDLNGLLILMFGTWCMASLGRLLTPGVPRMSDVMKLFSIFFLMRNMVTSTSPDLSNMVLGETVLILFAEKIEDRSTTRADTAYFLILVFAVMVTAVKLSSMFLCLVPGYLTLRVVFAEKRIPWLKALAVAAFITLPWLGRSPILSGYIAYPIYQIDVLQVDWKVPEQVARRSYYYVREFAKTDAKPDESERLANQRSVVDWVPVWFERENAFDKAIAGALLLAFVFLVPYGVARFGYLYAQHRDLLAFGILVMTNVVVWFLRFPAFRFGWAPAIILVAFSIYLTLRAIGQVELLRWGTISLAALFTLQNTAKTLQESRKTLINELILPASSQSTDVQKSHLGTLNVYISPSSSCWGTNPPCLPAEHDSHLQARGRSVEDGFRIAR